MTHAQEEDCDKTTKIRQTMGTDEHGKLMRGRGNEVTSIISLGKLNDMDSFCLLCSFGLVVRVEWA